MGFDSFFTGSKATRLMVAVLFASGLRFHAAEPAAPVITTNVAAAGAGSGTIENSVVKIFATVRYPNPYQPWTKDSPEDQNRQRRGD